MDIKVYDKPCVVNTLTDHDLHCQHLLTLIDLFKEFLFKIRFQFKNQKQSESN